MKLALNFDIKNEMSLQERDEIDEFITNAIEVHKNNSAQIGKLVMDSVTALTASDARAKELVEQNLFNRVLGELTGKNGKLKTNIDMNFTKSQYASQQMIQKLAEQNLLNFETITAVNNKLNTLMIEADKEINKIYETLVVFFKKIKSDVIQLENRIEKLERNMNLIYWNSSIEYQTYNRIEYTELEDFGKLVCVTNDFYHLTKGTYSTVDIMLLKSTLKEIGVPLKTNVSANDFFKYLIERPEMINRLFEKISLDGFSNINENEAPLIKGIEKLSKIQNDEKYVVDTVKSQLKLHNVEYNIREIQVDIIRNYLMNSAYMRSDVKINIFDLVVELLSNIRMLDSFENNNGDEFSQEKKLTEVIEDELSGSDSNLEEENKKSVTKEKFVYDVILIDANTNKVKVIKAIRELFGVNMDEAKQLIDNTPSMLIEHTNLEDAEKIRKIIHEQGATVEIKER